MVCLVLLRNPRDSVAQSHHQFVLESINESGIWELVDEIGRIPIPHFEVIQKHLLAIGSQIAEDDLNLGALTYVLPKEIQLRSRSRSRRVGRQNPCQSDNDI